MKKRLIIPNTDHLNYDPETGSITWAGCYIGVITNTGYLQITIDNTLYLAHRIAWYMFYKEQPPNQIDHINRNKLDNRITNLKATTHIENQQNRGCSANSTTKLKGIVFDRERGQYRVRLRYNNKEYYWGRYYNALDAIEARLDAEEYHWGKVCQQ